VHVLVSRATSTLCVNVAETGRQSNLKGTRASGDGSRGYSALVDQWRRAAVSIPLNIAEAVGKTSEGDRNNRYAIARGEAMECGAILDVVRLIEAMPEPELAAAKQLLVRVVGMLSRMCR
jgi:four helix bundle protein